MATLLSAVTSDGAGTGASHSGPCTVIVHNDSVFDGANIAIQIADTDTAADYVPIDGAVFRTNNAIAINGQGTYYLRAVVANAVSTTSLTVVTTN